MYSVNLVHAPQSHGNPEIYKHNITIKNITKNKYDCNSCALHNFLSEKSPARYASRGRFDTEDIESGNVIGEWRSDRNSLESVRISGSNNSSFDAKEGREKFCKYFNSIAGSGIVIVIVIDMLFFILINIS